VLALILIILALAAIAVLGTVMLTRNERKPNASQEDQVRSTIKSFDAAVQTGDLTTLRSITCGSMRDDYVNYNQHEWSDTYRRIAAAKQYPVVADIDQVVVDGNHAEANVTAFMAYAPQTRSARSFDLQYRDDQWKICESNSG
jgi:3',5'-cyclic AMP phosphodiesterase CpdA